MAHLYGLHFARPAEENFKNPHNFVFFVFGTIRKVSPFLETTRKTPPDGDGVSQVYTRKNYRFENVPRNRDLPTKSGKVNVGRSRVIFSLIL